MTDPIANHRGLYRRLTRIAAACALALTYDQVQAGLQGENLLQPLPAGFRIASEQAEGKATLTEMLPVDETVDQWTRMVTTQIYRGMDDTSFFAKYTNQMKGRWSSACDVADTKPFSDGVENGYTTHVWLQICAFKDSHRKPEITLFKFIQGRDAAYVVQMAFHFHPGKAQLADWMSYLAKVTVCDTRHPESPCPVDISSHITVKTAPEPGT